MIFLILGPFGMFFLFRIILPEIWCIDFLVNTTSNHKFYDIVILHSVYLLFEGFLIISLMIYIINMVVKYRRYRQKQLYINGVNYQGLKFSIISTILIVLFFIFNFHTLPIFMDGGSDAIVALGEQQKTKTWFMYGMLGTLTTLLLFSIIYLKSMKKKVFYGAVLLLASLVTGKKSALIGLFSKFIFVYFMLNTKKPKLPIIKIGFVLLLSIIFIVFQFSRTSGVDFDISQVFKIIFSLIYSSSTVYLNQFINMSGLDYAQMYSNSLGDGGSIVYILNPFMKFLFGIGIEKSIGPYLVYQFYGSEFPNGVNPTLFFEPIFVFGKYSAILFSFLNLFIVFILARYFIKKVIINFNKSILITITFFGLFMSSLSFTIDTLNTVRGLPFVLIPMFIFYFKQFLIKVSNSKKRKMCLENIN